MRQRTATRKVAEAVAAIDALAEALSEWSEATFLPLADAAETRSAEAFEAERRAARLAGDRASASRVQGRGWSRYPGLAAVVGTLTAYARAGADMN